MFYEATRPAAAGPALPRVFRNGGRVPRVLLQTDSFTQGGMEQVVVDLARSLRAENFDVALLVLGQQGKAVERSAKRDPVLTLPQEDRADHYHRLFRERIDIVNAHYSLFGAQIAADQGVPFVQTIHNAYVFIPPCDVEAYQANDPLTSAYVCVSQTAAQYSNVKLGLPASKMVVVPNGIELARLDAAGGQGSREALRRELRLLDEDFVFLNVASFQPVKCQTALLSAFADVVGEFPEAKLVLVGSALVPDYLTQVHNVIAARRLQDAVILAGQRHDGMRFHWAADAFVSAVIERGLELGAGRGGSRGPAGGGHPGRLGADLLPQVGGRLVTPPFGSMTNLDFLNLEHFSTAEYPAFVAELAAAMKEVRRDAAVRCYRTRLRRALDCKEAYKHYGDLFTWLMQGGHPSAARLWTARPPASSPVDDSLRPIVAAARASGGTDRIDAAALAPGSPTKAMSDSPRDRLSPPATMPALCRARRRWLSGMFPVGTRRGRYVRSLA